MIAEIIDIQKNFFNSDNKAEYDIFQVTEIKPKEFTEDVYRITKTRTRGFHSIYVRADLQKKIMPELYAYIRKNDKVVIAGGSLSWENGKPYYSDYDIFMLGDCSRIIADIIEILRMEYLMIYNRRTISFYEDTTMVYQIILRQYSSISEILHGFDIGSSCVAFDGERFWMTSMGRFAYEYGYNIVDMSFRSTTYEKRLGKYVVRGFGVILPKLLVKKPGNIYLEYMYISVDAIENYTIRGHIKLYTNYDLSYNSSPPLLVLHRRGWDVHSIVEKQQYNLLKQQKLCQHQLELLLRKKIEKIRQEALRELLDGDSIIRIDPTTQKFGMFDPSSIPEAKWYGENYAG